MALGWVATIAMGGAAAGTVTVVGVIGGVAAGGVMLAKQAKQAKQVSGVDFNQMVQRVVVEVVGRREAAAALKSHGKYVQ